jgi:hypothetical protein
VIHQGPRIEAATNISLRARKRKSNRASAIMQVRRPLLEERRCLPRQTAICAPFCGLFPQPTLSCPRIRPQSTRGEPFPARPVGESGQTRKTHQRGHLRATGLDTSCSLPMSHIGSSERASRCQRQREPTPRL